MSNPTELPDLDKLEALADAMPEHLQLKGWYVAAPSFGQQHVYADNFKGQGRQHIASLPAHKTYFAGLAEFIAAFDPATVKRLIALARRAQPESEARCVICGSTEARTGNCGSDDPRALCNAPVATLSPLCGAQHAESGKEVPTWRQAHKKVYPNFQQDDLAAHVKLAWAEQEISQLRAALAAQQAAAPDGNWLWSKLMDWCKKRGVAPANFDDLFAIVGEARAAQLDGGQEGSD